MRVRAACISLSFVIGTTAFGADKKCSVFKEDGTVIAEVPYEVGKYDVCLKQAKAKVVEALCTAGATKVKYQQSKDGGKTSSRTLDCTKESSAPGTTTLATTATAESSGGTSTTTTTAAGGASCEEKLSYINANAKWCDGTGMMKAKECGNKNDVTLIEKLYPKCVEQVVKFEGDPGEDACKNAAPKVKADADGGCATAMIIWKRTQGDCSTAENRRKLVNQSKSLTCRK